MPPTDLPSWMWIGTYIFGGITLVFAVFVVVDILRRRRKEQEVRRKEEDYADQ